MPTKVDFLQTERNNDILARAICSIPLEKINDCDLSAGAHVLEVTLKVNNIEFDLRPFFDNINQQIKDVYNNGFKDGVNHAVDEIKDKLSNRLYEIVNASMGDINGN